MTGVVISGSLVISPGADGYNGNSPIIGYNNIVTAGNIVADTADADHPVTNLANPATHLYWQSTGVVGEYLTVTTGTADDLDYLAIARHNFGTAQCEVSVEGTDGASPVVWTELTAPILLSDNSPVIFRWTPQPLYAVRLVIGPSSVAPFCAVMYVGKLLMLQRRLYVGHAPINYSRRLTLANQRSVSGNFLGRVVLGQSNGTSIALQHLTPAWVRSSLWPFILAAQEIPFFFAWRPGDYPLECGYAWLTNDPVPSNSLGNGMMSVSFELEGVI